MLRPRRDGPDRGAVEARVPEPVLVAGRCRVWNPSRAAAPGVDAPPTQVWVAVSRERIYAFEAGPDSVGELFGSWERHETVVEATPTLTATRLTLGFAAHGPRLVLAAGRFRPSSVRLARYLRNPDRA